MPYLLPILAPFLPGNVFKKTRLQWEELVSRFRDDPFFNVQQLRVRLNLSHLFPRIDCGPSQMEGHAEDSFVLRSLEDLGVAKEDIAQHAIIKDVAGTVFIGTSITSF